MPKGSIKSFKKAFLPKFVDALERQLQGLQGPLSGLERDVEVLRALEDPGLSAHESALEKAQKAIKKVNEMAETSVFQASAGVQVIAEALREAAPKATKAVEERKAELKRLAEEAITALELDKASAWLADDVLTGLRDQLQRGGQALDRDPGAAFKLLSVLPSTAQAATQNPAKKLLYDAALLRAERAVQTLKAHLQRAHVSAEILLAETAIIEAKKAAKADDPPKAMQHLQAAEKAAGDGTGFADKYAVYRTARAETALMLRAIAGFAVESWCEKRDKELAAADLKAEHPGRDYAGAELARAAVTKTAGDFIVKHYDTAIATGIKDLETHAATAWLADDIKVVQQLHKEATTAFTAREWRAGLLTGRRASTLMGEAKKLGNRRALYETEERLTVAEIDKLKTFTALFVQVEALRERVKGAARLADRKVARLEEAIAQLKETAETAKALARVNQDANACKTAISDATRRLGELASHVSAEHLSTQRERITAQLEEASGHYRKDDYGDALKLLTMVLSDLTAAEQLAESLKASSAAHAEAQTAAGEEAVGLAVAKLRGLAEAARLAPHADLVPNELRDLFSALDEASRLLTAKQPDQASASLKTASDLLITVNTVTHEHARILAVRGPLQLRVDQLRLAPAAVANKPNIDKVVQLIALADRCDTSRDWKAATTALRMGELDADVAELASTRWAEFNVRTTELGKRRDKLGPGQLKTDVTDQMAEAVKSADDLNFRAANLELDTAELLMDEVDAEQLTRTNPKSKSLTDMLERMMKAPGGPAKLDAMVQRLPQKTPVETFTRLARARFGVEFTLDTDTKKWESGAAKKLWEMMARVPEGHARGNPSLKRVKREEPEKNGGYYSSSRDLMVMNGRPTNKSSQRFGSKLKTLAGHPNLPDDVDERCKPKDETSVNYFDFAALHEVGHAVDDRLSFMATREGQPGFGGWRTHGGDLAPIAEKVAKKHKYNADYVLALMLGKDLVEPPPEDSRDQVDWDLSRDAVRAWFTLATQANAYRSQQFAEQNAIEGRVYQEAYAGTWVSYELVARKRGLTGYQFRAPGEWFAELYAGFYSGKIKSGHPSASWLKTL